MRRLVLFLLLLLPFVAEITTAATFSTSTRQLAWFMKPPTDGTLDTLAKNFHNFVLTRGDEKVRDSLKGKGITAPFLMYLVLTEVQDPGSCTATPKKNQVAYQAGDFCWLKQYHSDWFLKDSSGNRISNGSTYYYMDPGNSSFRSWWLSRAKPVIESNGWNGVFLDNVDASLARFEKLHRMPAKYTTDSSYSNAVQGFLNYLYTNYFKPQAKPLFANVTCLRSDSVFSNYLNYLDGTLTESNFVDWHTGYRPVSSWEADLKRMESAQSRGKRAYVVAQGDKSNSGRQQFSYASYLLAANGLAAFRYTNQFYYSSVWLYSNYTLDLGTPTGARYQKNGIWYRYFTRGYVTVDPVAHTAKIVKTS